MFAEAGQAELSKTGRSGIIRLPLLVFVVALGVRILFLVSPPAPELKHTTNNTMALRLLEGSGYVNGHGEPTSTYPPGYPLFLSAIYWAAGHSFGAVRLVQAGVDAMTCLVVYVLARRMFGDSVALVAAGLSIFSLGQIYATRLILTESLTTFLLVSAVLLLHIGLRRPSGVVLGGAGAVFGLGVLTKGTLLLAPFLSGWVIWRASEGKTRTALGRWAILLICFGLTLVPWTVRNYLVHGQFVLVSTEIGRNVYCGYQPFQGRILGICDNETFRRIKTTLPEAETARYVSDHPGVVPKMTLLKIIYFISPIDWELIPGEGAVNFTFVFAVPFAVYGIWLSRRGDWQPSLLMAMFTAVFLTVVLTESSPRYRLPVEPLMAVFSGLGLVATVRRIEGHRALALGGIVAFLAILFTSFVFGDQVRSAARLLLGTIGLW